MEKIDFCPFCGAENVSVVVDNDETTSYHCSSCERDFTDDDHRHEVLRKQVSSICSAFEATEEHPLSCVLPDAVELHVDLYEISQGLSEFEKPHVLSVFQDFEGIVWIAVEYDGFVELDDIQTDSIREILEFLKENYHVKTWLSEDFRIVYCAPSI